MVTRAHKWQLPALLGATAPGVYVSNGFPFFYFCPYPSNRTRFLCHRPSREFKRPRRGVRVVVPIRSQRPVSPLAPYESRCNDVTVLHSSAVEHGVPRRRLHTHTPFSRRPFESNYCPYVFVSGPRTTERREYYGRRPNNKRTDIIKILTYR